MLKVFIESSRFLFTLPEFLGLYVIKVVEIPTEKLGFNVIKSVRFRYVPDYTEFVQNFYF